MAAKYFGLTFDVTITRDNTDRAVCSLLVPANHRLRILSYDISAPNLASTDPVPICKIASAADGGTGTAATPVSRDPSLPETTSTTAAVAPFTTAPSTPKMIESRPIPLGSYVPQTYQGDSLVGAGGGAIVLYVNGGTSGTTLRVVGDIAFEE